VGGKHLKRVWKMFTGGGASSTTRCCLIGLMRISRSIISVRKSNFEASTKNWKYLFYC
jgi:hypothetical protein